jgi:hypothetical protein
MMFPDVYDYDVANERQSSGMRGQSDLMPFDDMVAYLRDYAREKPESMALWCFGIGFVLGWKMKFW